MGIMFRNGKFYGGTVNEEELPVVNAEQNQILTGDGENWIDGSNLYTLKNYVKAYDNTKLDTDEIGHTDYRLVCQFLDNDTNPQFIITGNKEIINSETDNKSGYNQELKDHESFNFILKDQAFTYFGGESNVVIDGKTKITLHDESLIEMDRGHMLSSPQIRFHGPVVIQMDQKGTITNYSSNPNTYFQLGRTVNGPNIVMHDIAQLIMESCSTIATKDKSLLKLESNSCIETKDNAHLEMDSYSQIVMHANKDKGGPLLLMQYSPVLKMDGSTFFNMEGQSTFIMSRGDGNVADKYPMMRATPIEFCFSCNELGKDTLKTDSTYDNGVYNSLNQVNTRSNDYSKLANFEYLPWCVIKEKLKIDNNCPYYFNSKKPFTEDSMDFINAHRNRSVKEETTINFDNYVNNYYITADTYNQVSELKGQDLNEGTSWYSNKLIKCLKIKQLSNLSSLLEQYPSYLTTSNSISFPNLWNINIENNITNWNEYFEEVYYRESNNFSYAKEQLKKYLGEQYEEQYFAEFVPIYTHQLSSQYIQYEEKLYTLIDYSQLEYYTQVFNNTEYRFINPITKKQLDNFSNVNFSTYDYAFTNIDGYLCKSGTYSSLGNSDGSPLVLFRNNVVFSLEAKEGFIKMDAKPDKGKAIKVLFQNNSYLLQGGNSHLEFLDNSRIIMRGNTGNTTLFPTPWLDGVIHGEEWITPIKQLDNGPMIGLYDSPTIYMRGKWVTDDGELPEGYGEQSYNPYFYIDGDYTNHSTNIENWKENEPELFKKMNEYISLNRSGYRYYRGGTASFRKSGARTIVDCSGVTIYPPKPNNWDSYMPKKENSPLIEITENSEIRFHQNFKLIGNNTGITISNGQKTIDFSFEELERLKALIN